MRCVGNPGEFTYGHRHTAKKQEVVAPKMCGWCVKFISHSNSLWHLPAVTIFFHLRRKNRMPTAQPRQVAQPLHRCSSNEEEATCQGRETKGATARRGTRQQSQDRRGNSPQPGTREPSQKTRPDKTRHTEHPTGPDPPPTRPSQAAAPWRAPPGSRHLAGVSRKHGNNKTTKQHKTTEENHQGKPARDEQTQPSTRQKTTQGKRPDQQTQDKTRRDKRRNSIQKARTERNMAGGSGKQGHDKRDDNQDHKKHKTSQDNKTTQDNTTRDETTQHTTSHKTTQAQRDDRKHKKTGKGRRRQDST